MMPRIKPRVNSIVDLIVLNASTTAWMMFLPKFCHKILMTPRTTEITALICVSATLMMVLMAVNTTPATVNMPLICVFQMGSMNLTTLMISCTTATTSSPRAKNVGCLLYTSDAADERSSVDLGGRRI